VDEAIDGYARCEACLNKDLIYRRKNYLDPKWRKNQRRLDKNKRERRRRLKLCIKCAAPLDGDSIARGYVTCINCRQRRIIK
jgi:DNA-directed RNA polymerase subunit RPC12/RpoP